MPDLKLPFNLPTTGNASRDFAQVAQFVRSPDSPNKSNVTDQEVKALQTVLGQMDGSTGGKAMLDLKKSDLDLYTLVKGGW